MGRGQDKALILKIVITWLCIFSLTGFFVAAKSTASAVTMSIIPEVPKAGQPVVATFNIKNPSDVPSTTSYQLYVNGRLIESGSNVIGPQNSSKYQYAYANPLERGEQVHFLLKANSESGSLDRVVALPPYPPQLMSSFVSFAAFSTSVMSSLITTEYFTDVFGTTSGLNTGIIIVIILITLLIFLELTQTITSGKKITILSHYRGGLGNLTSILFIIFVGMVFTKAVMILVT